MVAAAMIGSAVVGGVVSSQASGKAADTQANAANSANQTQLDMFNRTNEQQAPWRKAGEQGLSRLGDLLGISGNNGAEGYGSLTPQPYKPFTSADLKANLDPGYDFRMQQGIGATSNLANSSGGLISGNTLKALTDYGQGFASNEYQNAFNRYNTNFQNNAANQTNIYNRLAGIAGLGQTANQVTANAGMNSANNISANQIGAGNAIAAGQVGSANAWSGATNNLGSMYALNGILKNNGGSGLF